MMHAFELLYSEKNSTIVFWRKSADAINALLLWRGGAQELRGRAGLLFGITGFCAGWCWLCGWRPRAGPGSTWSCGSRAGCAGVLVDGGPRLGGGRLGLAGSPLYDDHHTFAFALGRWLQAH